jgi:hypothetical protein
MGIDKSEAMMVVVKFPVIVYINQGPDRKQKAQLRQIR